MALQSALIEATQFFTRDVLATEVELFDTCPLTKAWVASIDITGDENGQVAVHIPEKSLRKMAVLFLFEEDPSHETLSDLIGEIANLIVGRAKVTAQAKGVGFDISTPNFHGHEKSVTTGADRHINFLFEEEVFSITFHEESA